MARCMALVSSCHRIMLLLFVIIRLSYINLTDKFSVSLWASFVTVYDKLREVPVRNIS